MTFEELKTQTVELLPARTTMVTSVAAGGDGGSGSTGILGGNILSINAAILGEATQNNVAGAGGDGGDAASVLNKVKD